MYLHIKNEFSFIVSVKITFFDLADAKSVEQIEFKEETSKRYNDLLQKTKYLISLFEGK